MSSKITFQPNNFSAISRNDLLVIDGRTDYDFGVWYSI